MTHTPGPYTRRDSTNGKISWLVAEYCDCANCARDAEFRNAYGGHLIADYIDANNVTLLQAAPALLAACELAIGVVADELATPQERAATVRTLAKAITLACPPATSAIVPEPASEAEESAPAADATEQQPEAT